MLIERNYAGRNQFQEKHDCNCIATFLRALQAVHLMTSSRLFGSSTGKWTFENSSIEIENLTESARKKERQKKRINWHRFEAFCLTWAMWAQMQEFHLQNRRLQCHSHTETVLKSVQSVVGVYWLECLTVGEWVGACDLRGLTVDFLRIFIALNYVGNRVESSNRLKMREFPSAVRVSDFAHITQVTCMCKFVLSAVFALSSSIAKLR